MRGALSPCVTTWTPLFGITSPPVLAGVLPSSACAMPNSSAAGVEMSGAGKGTMPPD